MKGTGLPLATPFDETGDVDHDALAALVEWVETRGVDFIVPCGSNSEAPLLTREERAAVVETVAEAADGPVLAGTGTEGERRTLAYTRDAAEAGADAVLVVTPYYFNHDQAALADYYRRVADESPVPVYLYAVPAYTETQLAPETVGDLAVHPNIAGMKDSSGDIAALKRTLARVPDDFEMLVGSGGVYADALAAGATGGVLAVANVLPEVAAAVYGRSGADARAADEALLEVNELVTTEYGIPGLKAAMRARGAPAGRVRSPYRPVEEATVARLSTAVDEALAAFD
ncbi:dihydrodipicolinate synthase family protein [Halosegnis sp.]|uniref:dihydrodipicolinate synthase family protein n=1 Tax=Halosegnis sp. TaxID=2864959 RepID=UPI0035D42592